MRYSAPMSECRSTHFVSGFKVCSNARYINRGDDSQKAISSKQWELLYRSDNFSIVLFPIPTRQHLIAVGPCFSDSLYFSPALSPPGQGATLFSIDLLHRHPPIDSLSAAWERRIEPWSSFIWSVENGPGLYVIDSLLPCPLLLVIQSVTTKVMVSNCIPQKQLV